MDRYFKSVGDVILDRTPENLIGAILIAFVLAMAVAGLNALLRKKVSDQTVLLTCLVLAVNVLAMTVAAGYVEFVTDRIRPDAERQGFQPGPQVGQWPPRGRSFFLVGRAFAAADANGDGLLTPEEAAQSAGRFVERVAEGKPVDEETLREAVREQMWSQNFGHHGVSGEPNPEGEARSERRDRSSDPHGPPERKNLDGGERDGRDPR